MAQEARRLRGFAWSLLLSCYVALPVERSAAEEAGLPAAKDNPRLYEQLDIVPLPKHINLTGEYVPCTGPSEAVLALGPKESRSEQDNIGADWINRRVVAEGGRELDVVTADRASRGVWTLVVGTRRSNPLIEQASAQGRVGVGEKNPGVRGYEIRIDPSPKRVFLAGADPIGALYACVTFGELLERRGSRVLWRAALVRDWPDATNVNYPHWLMGPGAPTVWRLLLELARSTVWAEKLGRQRRAISPEQRETFLRAVKAEYDRLLRWKISSVTYGLGLGGERYQPAELYDLVRECVEYGKARGFAALRYCESPMIGLRKNYPELKDRGMAFRTGRHKGEIRGWCLDETRQQTAENLAKFVKHVGYTDVGFHDIDTGLYADPANWSMRSKEAKQRWGDDYASANLHKHMIYYRALKKECPDLRIHFVMIPYCIDILDPQEGEARLASQFGRGPGIALMAERFRKQYTEVWKQWHRGLGEDATFALRETSPEAVQAFRALTPRRGAFWWLAYLSRAWASPFSDRPSMVVSYIRDHRDLIAPKYNDRLVPVTCLATQEYAWNVNTPGAQPWEGGGWGNTPLLEHWRRGEPKGEVYSVILPHVVRNIFGRELAPPIVEALRQNVSPGHIFGYWPERFDPLTTLEKMQWQAARAAEAAAAMDRAWSVFTKARDRLALGVYQVAYLIQYREMFHGAAWMARIRVEAQHARALARKRDEAGARNAIQKGLALLPQAEEAMARLLAERGDLRENPVLKYGDGVKVSVDYWTVYLASHADFSFARKELEGTASDIPDLVAMTDVPEDIVDRLARGRTVRASQTAAPIVMDGELEERAWSHAFPVESFFLPGTKTIARAHTRARIVCDRENLYFGVVAYTPESYEVTDQDLLEVFASHPGLGRDYIHLFVNASGQVRQQYCRRKPRMAGIDGPRGWLRDYEWSHPGVEASPEIFCRWKSERAGAVAVKKEVSRGGVRIMMTSDEGTQERWIRFGGWTGTRKTGSIFVPSEKGGHALAGACFFAPSVSTPDGKGTALFDSTTGTIEFWLRPNWRGAWLAPFDSCELRPLRHSLINFGSPRHPTTYHRAPINIEHHDELGIVLFASMRSSRHTGGRASCAISRSEEWQPGAWRHIACVWDTTAAERKDWMRIYVDGKLRGRLDYLIHPELMDTNETTALDLSIPYAVQIGCRNTGLSPADAAFDELRISRAARYSGDTSPPDKPLVADRHTTALFRFDGDLRARGVTLDGTPYTFSATAGVACCGR